MAMADACAPRGSRGRTASVLASVLLVAADSLSAPATVSSSTSLLLSPTQPRSQRPRHKRLTRSNHNYTTTTITPVCPLSLTPPLPHRLYLVRVEKLAASTMARRCVWAHKLTRTPRLVRPTVSPLPLSLTVGQQPAKRWEKRMGTRRQRTQPATMAAVYNSHRLCWWATCLSIVDYRRRFWTSYRPCHTSRDGCP